MIPKIIHYCWFGKKELPDIVKHCIKSWERVMPDYEIRFWNEENVPINDFKFMKDAYSVGKYAFVSDYARYWILKQYGGFFLDSDVEVLKRFDILRGESIFFAFNKHIKQSVLFVNPGLIIGVEPNNEVIGEILQKYNSISFLGHDGKPQLQYSSPRILTDYLLRKCGLEIKDCIQRLNNGIVIYPTDYFDPINPRKLFGNKLEMTDNTIGIHHCAASWVPMKKKVLMFLSIVSRNVFGDALIDLLRGKEQMKYKSL